jgi:hypothetical protein
MWKRVMMNKKGRSKEPRLPLRSLHDFLFEIDNEWNKFRTGSLLSIGVSLILIFTTLPRFLNSLRQGGPVNRLFMIILMAILVYNAYLAYGQHKFYSTWEKRLGLLLHLEEKLLEQ